MSCCRSCGRTPEQHRHNAKTKSLPKLMRNGSGGFIEQPWERIRCRPPALFNPQPKGIPGEKTNVGNPLPTSGSVRAGVKR